MYDVTKRFGLVNYYIIYYSVKEIKALRKSNSKFHCFGVRDIQEIVTVGEVKDFPMGSFEYEYCVECLKLLRKALGTGIFHGDYTFYWSEFKFKPFNDIAKKCLKIVSSKCQLMVCETIEENRYKLEFINQ